MTRPDPRARRPTPFASFTPFATVAALAGALSIAAACGESRQAGDGAGSMPAAGATAAPIPLAAGDSASCPEDGRWRLCAVVDRLEDAGLVPVKLDEPARRDVFSVEGTTYRVARGTLEVYLYETPAALAHDVAAMDTVQVAPKGETGPWLHPPTFIRSANLLALYVGTSAAQAERVALALGAGPPQARPPE